MPTKFKPGQSGNPAGRPKGSRNKSTLLTAQLQDALPDLLDKTRELAMAGDTTALKLLLDRLAPIPKAPYQGPDIPELATSGTKQERARAILEALASGDIAPADAMAISRVANLLASATEPDPLDMF